MKLIIKTCLITLGLVSLSGCVSSKNAQQTAPDINANAQYSDISLAFHDQRPYVLDNDKTVAFEGIIRSGFGIPYSYDTYTKQPLTDYLSDRLSAGFEKAGVEVTQVITTPLMDTTEVKSALVSAGNKSILFEMRNWKYDTHAFSDGVYIDVTMTILDSKGKSLLTRVYNVEDNIPDNGGDSIINNVQEAYQTRFETIFAEQDVLDALKK